jgi:hypothetical protein
VIGKALAFIAIVVATAAFAYALALAHGGRDGFLPWLIVGVSGIFTSVIIGLPVIVGSPL